MSHLPPGGGGGEGTRIPRRAVSHLPPGGGGGGGGGGGHRCNINFSNGQSIGIVLYGMCSHSLYIKGEN